jgi:hypothetical protein
MTPDELKQDVIVWIAENPNAPQHWRDIAERLANYDDMASAWRELAKPKYKIQGRRVMGMAQRAFDAANLEVKRTLPSAEETERLHDVEVAAQKLIDAIDRAPLLDVASGIEIDGKPAMFAWRASGSKVAEGMGWPGQKVELNALLKYAVARAAELQNSLPGRWAKHQKSDPELAIFVRHAAVELKQVTGQKMMGTLARIASAALDRTVTKEQVNSILT